MMSWSMATDAMIDVRYIISRLQLPKRTKCKCFVFIIRLLNLVFVIPLKHLVIGIANNFQIFVNKATMYRNRNGCKSYLCF